MRRRRTLKIKYQADRLKSPGLTPEEFETEARVALAAHMYKKYEFSTGGASEFVDIPKVLFLQRMGEFGIPAFDLTPAEFEREVAAAQAAAKHLKKSD